MKKASIVFVIIVSLAALFFQVMAQATIAYGDTITSRLTEEMPVAVYTMAGNTDDRVVVHVTSLSDTLRPSVELRQGSDTITPDTMMIDESLSARFDFILPKTGRFLLMIAGENDTLGDFVLHVTVDETDNVTRFTGVPGQIALTDGVTAYYEVSNDTDVPKLLILRADDTESDFYTSVYDTDNNLLYVTVGSTALVYVEPQTTILIDLRGSSGTVTATWNNLTATSSAAPVVTTATDIPQLNGTPPAEDEETEEPIYATPEIAADAVCSAFSGGFPNIRTGPATTFALVTQVQPDQIYEVVGVYTNWYQLMVPIYGSGWVRGDVIGLGGNCAGIPALPPDNTPILPTDTPTITFTPSVTPTATPTFTPSATSTNTPTITPTASDTPRPTETEVIEIAPPDANFNTPLNVVLGGTTSVSEFVSFPMGDTEDMILWDVTGMSEVTTSADGRAQLTITATCFGDADETVEFIVDEVVFSCGETLIDREVTFDTKTGTVTIRATQGDDVYVQWVLQATASRLDS